MTVLVLWRLSQRVLVGALVLGGLLVASAAIPVSARGISCKHDPIISLSNGKQITITVTIATSASNVSSIVYTVHGPVGTTMTKIVYTGGTTSSSIEHVVYSADLPTSNYSTDTVATTSVANTSVTAATSIGTTSASAAGLSGTHILVKMVSR